MTTRLANTVDRLQAEIERLRFQLAATRREAIYPVAFHLDQAISLIQEAEEFLEGHDEAAEVGSDIWTWLHHVKVFHDPASVHESFGLHGKPADHIAILTEDAPTAPALAPLREAVVATSEAQWAAEQILIEATMAIWRAAVKLGGPMSRGPIAEACAALSAASATVEEMK